ncbi:RrF2 family transcriptional regulator [Kordiimonas pumila]|uniref:RrF2 family transcriptional regulator n=1 Tax=Kordiimonas pumila TaxID=2161677 RepID=A0ABV7D6V6_9PROT|nr:Rrf2 family transcriptional regulator [Kordiimonas pumila]
MISQKAKYALRALLELAKTKPGEALLITEIAARQNIPKKFLEQILLDLKHQGLLHSKRGRGGGYSLLRAPNLISFGQVLRIIDGPMAPLPCLSRMAYRLCEDCTDEHACEIRRVFATAYEQTAKVLDSTTLADAITAGKLPIEP